MIYSSCVAVCLLFAIVVHHAAEAFPYHEKSVDLSGAVALAAAVVGKAHHGTDARQKRSPAEELDFEIDDDMIITAATLDDSGCGARMLCEFTQKGPEQLDESLSRKLVQVFE